MVIPGPGRRRKIGSHQGPGPSRTRESTYESHVGGWDGVRTRSSDLHHNACPTESNARTKATVIEAIDERIIRRAALNQTKTTKRRICVLTNTDWVIRILQSASSESDDVPCRNVIVLHDEPRTICARHIEAIHLS